MNFNEAKVRSKTLRDLIEYHNDKYYNQDSPEIDDFEYDKLLHELEVIEERFPELVNDDSPTQRVGGQADSTFEKVEHKVQLASLHDVFSEDEIIAFDVRMKDMVGNPSYVVEPKIDGLSVAIEYVDGVFNRASTRGDGFVGEDVTENIRTIKTLPKKIKNAPHFWKCVVRCTCLITLLKSFLINRRYWVKSHSKIREMQRRVLLDRKVLG